MGASAFAGVKMIERTEQPELTSKDWHTILCVLLHSVGGGIALPGDVLRDFPENIKIEAVFDEVNDLWYIKLPRKKKQRRRVLAPNRKIIVPS